MVFPCDASGSHSPRLRPSDRQLIGMLMWNLQWRPGLDIWWVCRVFQVTVCCPLSGCSSSSSCWQLRSNYAENDVLAVVHQQIEDAALCRSPLGIYYWKVYGNYRCREELGQICRCFSFFFFLSAGFVLRSVNSHMGGVCKIRISFRGQVCLGWQDHLTQVSSGSRCCLHTGQRTVHPLYI